MNKHLQHEQLIAQLKLTFQQELCKQLQLTPIMAPLAIWNGTGINDDLNGVEQPVKFPIKSANNADAVIVQSLAKWKRIKLKEYHIAPQQGILTDMKALRPDETFSPLHSVYVDQWDWEKVMNQEERNIGYLKQNVENIFKCIQKMKQVLEQYHLYCPEALDARLVYITAEQLMQTYPQLTPKQREYEIVKKYKAVFIVGIGHPMSDGSLHDGRSADYDDWSTPNELGEKGLNGDILVWHDALNMPIELSSMGIRVNAQSLLYQLKQRNESHKLANYYHQLLINHQLPQSIGGGIGQSRMMMWLLNKKHIGEVQVGLWSPQIFEAVKAQQIFLL